MDEGTSPEGFANAVADLCYEHFKRLPKTGKPQIRKEWTLLASIVMSRTLREGKRDLKVVATATGTKCVGHSLLSNTGDIVNDSHAEILCRRAFIRYLFHQLSLVCSGKKSEVLKMSDTVCCMLKPGVKFHLFCSHTPCGDASIFPKDKPDGESVGCIKRTSEDDCVQPESKKLKLSNVESGAIVNHNSQEQLEEEEEKLEDKKNKPREIVSHETETTATQNVFTVDDIYRTGAKCVKNGVQDPQGRGKEYHVIGALRTKPGRGEETWSMSCSDKIALWNVCGVQGALMSHFLDKPIYLSSVIIGKCPFSKESLRRAIIDRTSQVVDLPEGYQRASPSLLHADKKFEFSRENLEMLGTKVVPCPAAIIWSDVPQRKLDVSVNGKKQGVTKKCLSKGSSSVSVCRKHIFEEFLCLLKEIPKGMKGEIIQCSLKNCSTYLDYKKSSQKYQGAKNCVFTVFHEWMQKPKELQIFRNRM